MNVRIKNLKKYSFRKLNFKYSIQYAHSLPFIFNTKKELIQFQREPKAFFFKQKYTPHITRYIGEIRILKAKLFADNHCK